MITSLNVLVTIAKSLFKTMLSIGARSASVRTATAGFLPSTLRTCTSITSSQRQSWSQDTRCYSCLTSNKKSKIRNVNVANTRRDFSLASSAESFRLFYLSLLDSTPVTFISGQLCQLHDATGLPWFAVIAGVTVAVRGAGLLPAHVTAQKTIVKRAVLFQQLDKQLIPLLKQKVREKQIRKGWTDDLAKAKFNK